MTEQLNVQQMAERLCAADNILVLCHKNPDGDTIGSLIMAAGWNAGFMNYIGALLFTIGGAAFGFLLPALSGYIAFGLAGRPGIAPGFVGGVVVILLFALLFWRLLRAAFRTDVEPILAMARLRAGAAIDPIAAYRASGYRARVAALRPKASGGGGGIV